MNEPRFGSRLRRSLINRWGWSDKATPIAGSFAIVLGIPAISRIFTHDRLSVGKLDFFPTGHHLLRELLYVAVVPCFHQDTRSLVVPSGAGSILAWRSTDS